MESDQSWHLTAEDADITDFITFWLPPLPAAGIPQDVAVVVDGGSGVPPLFFTQKGRLGLLIRHFQEQQKRELFDVVAVGQAVITEDVAVVPEFLDEGGWCAHFFPSEIESSLASSATTRASNDERLC